MLIITDRNFIPAIYNEYPDEGMGNLYKKENLPQGEVLNTLCSFFFFFPLYLINDGV